MLGALVWGVLGALILLHYRRIGGGEQALKELWLLLSLLWGQFGFAALVWDWRLTRGRGIQKILIWTFTPPLLLRLLLWLIL